ncbi:hypothetical protein ACIBCT_18555 [Streptosporangium sp. NPDC050855]|uniref:hypothetical protein n=1 Tax=Streptosporangium sp. NPDC050855 TaxID=3366194 RepID=UPI00378D3D71
MTTAVLIVLVWTSMISMGGVIAETVMLYPNIFRDPPASLVLTREFIVAAGPSDFFPPLGLTTVIGAVLASLLTWRTPSVRRWIVPATVVFVCAEFLFSALFFWPRNTIMFVDPVGTHSAAYLRTVAAEFETGHWVRVVGGVVTSGLAFTGLLRWHRDRVASVAGVVRPGVTASP